jgi:hypothetical protein
MADTKPFASLSSGLLARKGAAKPAMRPQGFGQIGVSLDDLGWNDMGYGQDAPATAAYTPAREPTQVVKPIAALTLPPPAPEEAPAVVEQQRAIEASFAPEAKTARPPRARRAAATAAAPRRQRAASGSKAKTAFTLRLDPERHLKLRLACALRHCSAQQIVTEALDEFLAGVPELDGVAQQAAAGKRN